MIYRLNQSQRGSTASVVALCLSIVLAAAVAAGGVYVWRQHRVDQLTSQVASLNAQVANLQAKSTGQPTANDTYTSERGVKVVVYTPAKGEKVASPVAVVGQVPGSWSFEASFPIELKNAKGAVVATGTGQLLGDWMTSALVPFSAKLSYVGSQSGTGTLVLHKDNPSGLAANADTVTVPVQF